MTTNRHRHQRLPARRVPGRGLRGASLVETLAAVAAVAVVVAASYHIFGAEDAGQPVRGESAAEIEAAKSSIEEMKYHLRLAGRNLPPGLAPLETHNGNPDAVTVCYRLADYEASLARSVPRNARELPCDSGWSRFSSGDRVYLHDPASERGEWIEIAGAATETQTLLLTRPLSRSYPVSSLALPLRQVTFYVTEPGGNGSLVVDVAGEARRVCARDVGDLQLRYRLKNGSVVDNPERVGDVREALVALSGGSARGPEQSRQSRSLAASIYLRNLGI